MGTPLTLPYLLLSNLKNFLEFWGVGEDEPPGLLKSIYRGVRLNRLQNPILSQLRMI